MYVDPLGGETEIFGTSAAERAQLTRDDFMKILTAELAYQDPFEPFDNKEFLGQLTQLQTLEATSSLTDSIGYLIRAQEMATASQFLGRIVSGVTDDGLPIEGLAEKVIFENGAVRLRVGGSSLALGLITEVRIAE